MQTLQSLAVLGNDVLGQALAQCAQKAGVSLRHWTGEETDKTDPAEVVADASLIVLCVPMNQVHDVIERIALSVTGDQCLVHTVKGIQHQEDRVVRISEMIHGATCLKKIGALACPVEKQLSDTDPCGLVVSSRFPEVAQKLRLLIRQDNLMVFENPDLVGVEMGMALSGLFTVAFGVAAGLELGAASRSLIMTRSLTEMGRIGAVLGARATTFSGIPGLGLLFATIQDEADAGFQLGLRLGRGEPIDPETDWAQNYSSLQAIIGFVQKKKLATPILSSLYAMLVEKQPLPEAMEIIRQARVGQEQDPTLDTSGLDLPIPRLAPRGGAGKDL